MTTSHRAVFPNHNCVDCGAPIFDGECAIVAALKTLPESMTEADILATPPLGAKWVEGALPKIGDVVRCRFSYPSNQRGRAVPPMRPGTVIGYYAEHGYLYAVTMFPGKAVLVGSIDIIQPNELGNEVAS